MDEARKLSSAVRCTTEGIFEIPWPGLRDTKGVTKCRYLPPSRLSPVNDPATFHVKYRRKSEPVKIRRASPAALKKVGPSVLNRPYWRCVRTMRAVEDRSPLPQSRSSRRNNASPNFYLHAKDASQGLAGRAGPLGPPSRGRCGPSLRWTQSADVESNFFIMTTPTAGPAVPPPLKPSDFASSRLCASYFKNTPYLFRTTVLPYSEAHAMICRPEK